MMDNTQQTAKKQYDQYYGSKNFYWSKTPSAMCLELIKKYPPTKPIKLLDIGCGEGRNSVFFARNGYEVHAFDISEKGVEKTKTLAKEAGVDINVFQAELNQYRLNETYDILFSTGVLHCMKPELRNEIFDNYKSNTKENGIHAFSVFVKKPFISRAPDEDPNSQIWTSGELLALYSDWLINWSCEEIFDCMSSGVPHRHAVNRIISEKIGDNTTLKGTAKSAAP